MKRDRYPYVSPVPKLLIREIWGMVCNLLIFNGHNFPKLHNVICYNANRSVHWYMYGKALFTLFSFVDGNKIRGYRYLCISPGLRRLEAFHANRNRCSMVRKSYTILSCLAEHKRQPALSPRQILVFFLIAS